MKKKLLLTVFALGAFLLGSCDNLAQNDPPRDLVFTANALKENTAVAGALAGSFSAQGGSGALTYSLVPGYDTDYDLFAVDGELLKVKESLAAGPYSFHAQVQDEEGRFVDGVFSLNVDDPDPPEDPPDTPDTPDNPQDTPEPPPEGPQTPDEPAVPEAPDVPGEPETPGQPEDPGAPEAPVTPGQPETPEEPEEPGAPEAPVSPGQPGTPGEPEAPPAEPDAPDTPGQPGQPGQPSVPGQPEIPGDPEEPAQPEDPAAAAKPARAINLSSSPGMRLVNLSWDASARAASYEVYYSLGETFDSATKFALEPAEPKAMVTGLTGDGRAYNFWVVAKNAAGKATVSRPHLSDRISDPIPDYLRLMAVPGGKTIYFVASNLWPNGDRYGFQDLGEDVPAHERYLFSYGAGNTGIDGSLYPGGTLKFVRTFRPPAKITAKGPNADVAGALIYEFERTVEGQKVKTYQAVYFWDPHLPPTVLIDYQNHPSHPPAAVMGNANGYGSGMGNTQQTDALAEAVAKYGHAGTGVRGSGGMTDYISNMIIYYSYNPDL
jgi:hypothetical protein